MRMRRSLLCLLSAVGWILLLKTAPSTSQQVVPEEDVQKVREAARRFSDTHSLRYDDVWPLASYLTDRALRPANARESLELLLPHILAEGAGTVLEGMRETERQLGLQDGEVERTLAATFDMLRAENHDGVDVLELSRQLRPAAEPRLHLLLRNSSAARGYSSAAGELYAVVQALAELRPRSLCAKVVRYRFVNRPPEGSDAVVDALWRFSRSLEAAGGGGAALHRLLREHGRSLAAYGGVGMARAAYRSDEQLGLAYLEAVARLDALPATYQREVDDFLQTRLRSALDGESN